MFKKQLKTILLAIVATFSISTVVNAKPIPKNATADQIINGTTSGTYTGKDLQNALNKEYPNVLGVFAYIKVIGDGNYTDSTAYSYAKKAANGGDAVGKFVEAYLYTYGYQKKAGLSDAESKALGLQLTVEACKAKADQKLTSDLISGVCKEIRQFFIK